MTIAVAVTGAAGLVLFLSGLPLFRRSSAYDRIAPYLPELGDGSVVRGGPARDARWIARFGSRSLPDQRRLEHRLAAAGSRLTPADLRLEQFQWGVAGIVTVLVPMGLLWALGVGVDVEVLPVLAFLGAASGYSARDRYLTHEVARRRERMLEDLPTAIDLLTLAIVAGEALPSALQRVTTTLEGELAEGFDRMLAEMRAGKPLAEALEDLAAHVPDPGMRRFVEAVTTSLERGTPLADVLRAQAEDFRTEERRKLMEQGGRREILMLVPVVFLMMPVVVVFALYPGLVSLDLLVP